VSGTFAMATLGCKTNQFETAAMIEQLLAAGYRQVNYSDGAELVIVNTCTVTATTDAQSRNLIRRARRINPACRVVVTGCYAQIDPQSLAAIPGVSLVLGNEEKQQLIGLLAEDRRGVAVSDIRQAKGASMSLSTFSGRTRAFVQIQNGCDAFCSYCIIPYARGPSRSVTAEQVLGQVRDLSAGGYPEIVLTGIHIGAYGLDLDPADSLLALVQRIEGETPVRRLRLGSLEPQELSPELLEAVAASKVVCPHLHLPLQSGDDEVLQRMNRHYTADFFRRQVAAIYAAMPAAAIGLDVITGFPGETDEAFRRTRDLIEELPISHLHVFPFSRRPGTPAARMPGQVPGPLARQRAAELRALGEAKLQAFSLSVIGDTVELVVEGRNRGGWQQGLSRQYLTVSFEAGEKLEGRTVQVQVTEWTEQGLLGRRV
jgi:threonylcarbamoyladenosine tRNA methylthiotransferase MtaB